MIKQLNPIHAIKSNPVRIRVSKFINNSSQLWKTIVLGTLNPIGKTVEAIDHCLVGTKKLNPRVQGLVVKP